MSEYDKLCNIRSSILTTYAMITNYESWSDKLKLSELKDSVKKLSQYKIDINQLTLQETVNLGFGK